MTFKEYYKLNIPTFAFCLKFCGIIFTVIAAIISVLIELTKNSDENPFVIFVACVIFGNLFGLFIAFLGLVSGFNEAKNLQSIIDHIPSKIKNTLSLELRKVNDDYRFNFLNFKISGNSEDSAIWIDYIHPKKEVWIGTLLNITDYDKFEQKLGTVNNTYRNKKIQLTGFGLVKTVKLKKWKRLTENQILEIISELSEVCKNEQLEIKNNFPRSAEYSQSG